MADTADITLRIVSRDSAADSAGAWGTVAEYEATEGFDRIERGEVEITDDNPKAVSLGDLPSAAMMFLRVTSGGKVRARVTSADGAIQSVPVDPVGFLVSMSVPITAIDLTRVAGSGVTVRVRFSLGAPLT
jgi:hypothetical protein